MTTSNQHFKQNGYEKTVKFEENTDFKSMDENKSYINKKNKKILKSPQSTMHMETRLKINKGSPKKNINRSYDDDVLKKIRKKKKFEL
jgi:hypothetical protein